MSTEENILTIGITGHRQLTEEQSTALKPVIKKAIDNIIFYHQHAFGEITEKVFSSSLAEGADRLFAHVAIENFDCKLKVILPFEKQEYLKDFESPTSKNEFELLLTNKKVTQIIELDSQDTNDRKESYYQAGKNIVDENEYLLAIWNEKKAKGYGGTGDMVKYAKQQRKNILVINPYETDLKIKGSYLPELVRHHYRTDGQKPGENVIEQLFYYHDEKSKENRDHYNTIWIKCFNLGLVAAFLFAVVVAFQKVSPAIKLPFNLAGLVCIFVIRHLVLQERKRSFHKQYLKHRYIAERLRIIHVFFQCGYLQRKIEGKAVHEQVVDLEFESPLGFITNKLMPLCLYSDASLAEKKKIAEALIDEQKNYHAGKIKELEKKMHGNELISKRLFFVFLVLLTGDIVKEVYHSIQKDSDGFHVSSLHLPILNLPMHIGSFLLLLSLFVPVLIARYEAKKYVSEWKKFKLQSIYMSGHFRKISGKIQATLDEAEFQEALNTLNENMYMENLEWEMFAKNEILQ